MSQKTWWDFKNDKKLDKILKLPGQGVYFSSKILLLKLSLYVNECHDIFLSLLSFLMEHTMRKMQRLLEWYKIEFVFAGPKWRRKIFCYGGWNKKC